MMSVPIRATAASMFSASFNVAHCGYLLLVTAIRHYCTELLFRFFHCVASPFHSFVTTELLLFVRSGEVCVVSQLISFAQRRCHVAAPTTPAHGTCITCVSILRPESVTLCCCVDHCGCSTPPSLPAAVSKTLIVSNPMCQWQCPCCRLHLYELGRLHLTGDTTVPERGQHPEHGLPEHAARRRVG